MEEFQAWKRTEAKRLGRGRKTTEEQPLWKKILLGIPKNLVYVFAAVIALAFLGMMYITYTEKNMTEFLTYDRTKEVIIVDPLFKHLQQSMNIAENPVTDYELASNLTPRQFFTQYVFKNKPVMIKNACDDWEATSKWTDKAYLIRAAGRSQSSYNIVYKADNTSPWSLMKQRPQPIHDTFENVLRHIENNSETTTKGIQQYPEGQSGPQMYKLAFMDHEPIRAPQLRKDYEFPFLHKLLKMQSTTISIMPKIEQRVKFNPYEAYECVLDGQVEFRMLSIVFKQNIYSGVYDDLLPRDVPEDISLFAINSEKYPLLQEVEQYVKTVILNKGDCLYLPSFHFYQSRIRGVEEATSLSFTYTTSSRLTDILIQAIDEGVVLHGESTSSTSTEISKE